jgi:hypothetical protein
MKPETSNATQVERTFEVLILSSSRLDAVKLSVTFDFRCEAASTKT